jgi:GrpB-like predicted nucleotidyltransferase (UPF0157 family)
VPEQAIVVIPYDPAWPRLFTAERIRLEAVLEPWLDGGIHHIGSTSIPGLSAKPLIDMLAGVRNLEQARPVARPLTAARYIDAPHRPDLAHHFAREGFGLHLTERGSTLWRERLAFRDALLADQALAAEYEALKLRLARDAPDARAYTDGKRAFVHRVLVERGIDFAWSDEFSGSARSEQ